MSNTVKLAEGLLIVALVVGVGGWLLWRGFRPAAAVEPEISLAKVAVEALNSPTLQEVAATINDGRTFGVPVPEPSADLLGKTPLL